MAPAGLSRLQDGEGGEGEAQARVCMFVWVEGRWLE